MIPSIDSPEVKNAVDAAATPGSKEVTVDGVTVTIPTPFPSPADWRDQWIYFLMIDRFRNSVAGPRTLPWDSVCSTFQGGNLEGIRAQLPYIRDLGAGAIWITPPFKNCQYEQSYHGYGIQDFLQIDPRFASDPARAEEELRALVDEAHAHDLYVIFDIVLNHAGDVFAYECRDDDASCKGSGGALAQWSDTPYAIHWRDEHGDARPDWTDGEKTLDPPPDAAVWPAELRRNTAFRRHGMPRDGGDPTIGDFYSLKQFLSTDGGVHDTLIRAYQYIIARFDIDGFRIDTLKYLDPSFAKLFGNAVREFALSIGKKNFFTFGEVYDNEEQIARFIGRHTVDDGDIVGVDAALDFPLFYNLPRVVKGLIPPSALAGMYQHRKQVEQDIVSSHGEASRFFVTFLDNHDQPSRFFYSDPADPQRYDDQLALGAGCLFSLQGIPCLYYGTEQGLHGMGSSPEAVREALWGKPNAFDPAHPFYETIRQLGSMRQSCPALRYGRQYFRPISGDHTHFGLSGTSPGIVAFSRILSGDEVVIVVNTSAATGWSGDVVVDFNISPVGTAYRILFSNKGEPASPGAVSELGTGAVTIQEVDGSVTQGPVHVLPVTLQPMEIQILAN